MANATQTIEADLTWTGERFEPGVRIRVRGDGRIEAVGALPESPTLRLAREALLPGLINSHSHSVLSGLRSRVERYGPAGSERSSWIDMVSRFTRELDLVTIHSIALQAFREMRRSGITSVGEFLDLDVPGASDADLSRTLLRAAADAGIRIELLRAFRGDFAQTQSVATRRRLESYWETADQLETSLAPTQTLAVAIPSLLATPLDDIEELYADATSRGMVFHVHVEGGAAEIKECRKRYGASPLAMLNRRLEIMANFTAIHCTRSDPEELDRFLDRGASVCVTPLTDAALGSGVQNRLPLGVSRISVGTGANLRIGMIEELRWLEFGQRLEAKARGLFRDRSGRVAPALLGFATGGGAHSLGLNAGRIAPGFAADFFTVDLGAPALEDASPDALLERLVFSGHESAIRRTSVDGIWASNDASLPAR